MQAGDPEVSDSPAVLGAPHSASRGGVLVASQRILRKHPRIWIALLLWIASNAFVTGVATVATWEGGASYSSLADLCQWDCAWYSTVLISGYDKSPYRDADGSANWQFQPLFPITAYPVRHWLKFPPGVSLVIASKLALLLAIYGFLLMMDERAKSRADLFWSGSLVAFNPYLIYAHAGYAEPLYFAVFTFALYFANRRKWIASGILGALLSVTRVVGFLFCISYAIVCLRDFDWRGRWKQSDLDRLIGFALCPLGTALLMLYMHHHTGDALAHIHGLVAWGKSPGNPFSVLWSCFTGQHWLPVWGVMTVAGFAASAWLFKLRRPELGTYLALSILIPLSAGYWGLPRYIWWQPPFMYAIYCALRGSVGCQLIYTCLASGMSSFMVWQWFTRHNFVV